VKFKVGDKVFLRPESINNDGYHNNPLNVIGIVTRILTYVLPVSVEWSNSTENVYYHEDLIPASKLGRYLYGIDTAQQDVVELIKEDL
jgi:hypothetical protein